jgi:hypothetical protein
MTPHLARKRIGSTLDGRTMRHTGYALKIHERAEEGGGGAKTVGGLRKTRLVGLAQVATQTDLLFL